MIGQWKGRFRLVGESGFQVGVFGAKAMKKFLFFLLIIVLALGGTALWLAGQATSGKPEAGEIRIEVEDVL